MVLGVQGYHLLGEVWKQICENGFDHGAIQTCRVETLRCRVFAKPKVGETQLGVAAVDILGTV